MPAMAFDVAAASYDRFMGAWSGPLSTPFADFAGVTPGARALDVGCGPGSLTTVLVARLGADRVAAVDPSAPFVEAARARHPGVDVRQAAAEALPFPDAAFDAALAQLVVHFMTDPVAGLREMARVTTAGGVVAACVWDFGTGRAPLSVFWRAVLELDPAAHDESGLAGARAGDLQRLFREAGLGSIQGAELTVTRSFAGFDDWWEPYTHGVGPAGSYVSGLDDEHRAALRDRCRTLLPDGAFDLTAVGWAVRGRVADSSPRADRF
jgi:SAM-dependent methyltransferase